MPAVLAVSHEQFIVFTSNAFAILGLRSLYFLLADMHGRFRYLQQGLAVILAFVGVKMIIAEWYHIPTWLSLASSSSCSRSSIACSLRYARRAGRRRVDARRRRPSRRRAIRRRPRQATSTIR